MPEAPEMPATHQQNVAGPTNHPGGAAAADLAAGVELKPAERLRDTARLGASWNVNLGEATEDELDRRENLGRSRGDLDRVDQLVFGLSLAVAVVLAAIACLLA
jgi:hypothetical protein